jgi:hypothetical protein
MDGRAHLSRRIRPQGSIVYLLKYPVPFDYLYEFDAWFQYEHMPMLFEEPAWYGCELFRALGASSYTFAALQYLEPHALKSDARNRSVDTPWWHRLCATSGSTSSSPARS